MFKKLIYLNLILLAVIILLGINLARLWFSTPLALPVSPAVTTSKGKEKPKVSKATRQKPTQSHYLVIGTRNLFRPQREEWTAPPPKPKKPTKKKKPPIVKEEAPPPPLPNPIVRGIIWLGEDNRIALMEGHHREEVAAPPPRRISRRRSSRKPSKPRVKIVADKIQRYRVGDEISEARILEILTDRVVLERDGNRFEVLLHLPKKQKAKTTSSPKTPTAAAKPPKETLPFPHPGGVIPQLKRRRPTRRSR